MKPSSTRHFGFRQPNRGKLCALMTRHDAGVARILVICSNNQHLGCFPRRLWGRRPVIVNPGRRQIMLLHAWWSNNSGRTRCSNSLNTPRSPARLTRSRVCLPNILMCRAISVNDRAASPLQRHAKTWMIITGRLRAERQIVIFQN